MPAANRPPNPPTDFIQLRNGPAPTRPDRPHKSIGKGSRTRFLSVKKFRVGRVRGMLLIGAVVVAMGFLAWCVYLFNSQA